MPRSTLQRTVNRGGYVVEWFNDAGDRGFSAVGKQFDRAARRSPRPVAKRLKSASRTLKRSDFSDVPVGVARAARMHPYRTLLIGAAAVYLVQRWWQR